MDFPSFLFGLGQLDRCFNAHNVMVTETGMQVMLGIRVGQDARTRSNMLSCLIGSVTSWTRLKSLSMPSKMSYTVLHVQSGLIDGSQSTHENLGRFKSPRTRI